MQLSEDILDHIFGYLVSHRETLVACSKDPYLSSIVKRHLYYHLIVNIGNRNQKTISNYALKPGHLAQLVSESPHILYNVRILEIQLDMDYKTCKYWMPEGFTVIAKHLDEFANLLLMFPVLECIRLTSGEEFSWYWPDAFRTALEDRLHLSTVEEVHIRGVRDFPLSLFDNCNNLKKLVLSAPFTRCFYDSVSTLPKLQSLAVSTDFIDPPYLTWIKLHINELRSLKCMLQLSSGQNPLPMLLEGCSQTLNKLDICLGHLRYSSGYTSLPESSQGPLSWDFTPFPSNLQQLTIRIEILLPSSWLPSAAEIIKLFTSSIQLERLVLDIDTIRVSSTVAEVDFSPLEVLVSVSLSIPRIDLYVHTGVFPSAVTHNQLLCLLDEYEEILRLYKEGVLIIHSEETAPDA